MELTGAFPCVETMLGYGKGSGQWHQFNVKLYTKIFTVTTEIPSLFLTRIEKLVRAKLLMEK